MRTTTQTEALYKVAGHIFRLSFIHPEPIDCLRPYTSFRLPSVYDGDCLFHLSVVNDEPSAQKPCEPIGQFDDDVASIGVFRFKDGGYRFLIAPPGNKAVCSVMETDAGFHSATIRLAGNPHTCFFELNNAIMLLYAFAAARLDTLLMHASVIRNEGDGYMFLGKSGTGKSTHSRLWLEHIQGSELLNDDNPVVRLIDGKAYVFGTPWSGKTPCYRNESVPLKGIARLRQAPENKIMKLSALQAYAASLPSCSCMKWDENIMAGIYRTVEQVGESINCCRLECLPDKAAAELCYETLKGNK